MDDNGLQSRALEFFGIASSEQLILNRDKIVHQIEDWLRQKAEIDTAIKNNYEILKHQEQLGRLSSTNANKYYDISSAGLKKLVDNYNKQRRDLAKLQDSKDLEEHLKDGYRMIHYFRDLLTGSEIKYSIAYESNTEKGREKEIFEAKLNLEQVLSAVSFNFPDLLKVKENTKVSNKIKMVISGTSIRNLLEDPEMKEIENITDSIANKKLWDSMIKIREENFRKYSGNMGQLYEAYFSLFSEGIDYAGHREGEKDTIGKAKSAIQKAIKDRTPGWKAGDVGNTQLKAVLGSSIASLIAAGSIERTLISLMNALKKDTKTQIKQSLIKLFTMDLRKATTEIDKQAQKDAIAYIEELFKKLDF